MVQWGQSREMPTVQSSRQLLVEGREEVLFFSAFLRRLQAGDIQVRDYEGKDNLRSYLLALTGLVDFPQVQSIGIVRDADESARSAMQSVQNNLRNSGLPVPSRSMTPEDGPPKISVFIMPDNASSGALEKLCLSALVDEPAMSCVEEFLQCVKDRTGSGPKDGDKARIHAFLASRQDPELRLGEAAQRGYIPWNRPAFADLTQFLRNL